MTYYRKRHRAKKKLSEKGLIQAIKNCANEILCFFDKGELVVLTNCFIKKTQKTPGKEIKMAEKLKKEYMNEKCGGY